MKIGVNMKIDVSKINKSLLYQGKKGVYLDATVFIDPSNPSQYGDHGMITQDTTKDSEDKGPILGNCTIFWSEDAQQAYKQGMPGVQNALQQQPQAQQAPQQQAPNDDAFDDMDSPIPF